MEQEQIQHLDQANLQSYYKADIPWASASKTSSWVLYHVIAFRKSYVSLSDYHT